MNERIIVDHLEIITTEIDKTPYYEIKYHIVGTSDYNIGYSSYNLAVVLAYILKYFTII